MLRLPVIVGFGGVNAAGRSSFHHAHNRLVFDKLDQATQARTLQSLATLMQRDASEKEHLLANTLIRKIHESHFDTENIEWNKRLPVSPADNKISFITTAYAMPDVIPENWQVADIGDRKVRVDILGDSDFMLPTTRQSTVRSAGQIGRAHV